MENNKVQVSLKVALRIILADIRNGTPERLLLGEQLLEEVISKLPVMSDNGSEE